MYVDLCFFRVKNKIRVRKKIVDKNTKSSKLGCTAFICKE